MKKTNAVRVLESESIKHRIVVYEFNEEEIDAVSVARKINMEPERVFKTLVAVAESKFYVVFCIPGNYELNMKKAAKEGGFKKIEMLKLKDLQDVTGYIRGGCSPIGMKKQFPTYIDESAQLFETIYVSAGVRGMQVELNPDDLIMLIKGKLVDLI